MVTSGDENTRNARKKAVATSAKISSGRKVNGDIDKDNVVREQVTPLHDGSTNEEKGGMQYQLSIERREEMLANHPVVRGHYTVPTPMLVHAHEEARDRVWSRRTGVVFYGETRAGKTTCAKSVWDYLREEFNDIHITMASARQSLRPKQGQMARVILEGCGHGLANRTDPEALLRNVILDVQTRLASLGGDQYVLILDEVNLCNELDLTELMEIHNILWMKGIKMTTISFGQPDVLHLITSLLKTDKKQICARFFRKPIPFLCCNSQETLEQVLQCLDQDTEWPEGSGWTYTYFFFPRAFTSGFRIASYATAIWNALVDATPGGPSNFTMEAIALTINGLYISMRCKDRSDFTLSDEDIINAIEVADI
ncbi:hypothetical protein BLA6993_04115 [Burkholderia lata]|uniref:ATP-binding protein n=1 Tax=Burkholderia lata (strain ATCC 17760 / DSM 23089 / LMG 22485 / NCIMB 9086 / R18194 / 383) TaxID=482957 RepID=UPI0014548AA4|nr:ATP-binding protein [Burkholderia lata]VWB86576.1 hypothetical protein BLA6993_04115 [Burkholderia lata]